MPAMDTQSVFGVIAPVDVPAEILARLNTLLVRPAAGPALAARLTAMGYSIIAGSPERLKIFRLMTDGGVQAAVSVARIGSALFWRGLFGGVG
jgi:hypothetical protein